jgi:Kef-type K+ transport system membrane component KefB/Trk K+ transport system NAD-binding subunit/mannitol/fructose-specific phosphotransferase system IIA component
MEFSILNLLLVLLVAWLAGILAQRLGYPSVLGELLAGIVLGPPLLGLLQGSEAIAVLAEVGILLMMLYIGMEIDPGELKKASKGGLLAALGGFLTPFVLCYLLITWAGGSVMAAIFVGVAAGVTSLATKSRILVDLQLLDTRIAHVMMAGALVADTISLVIFAGIIGVAEAGSLEFASLAAVVFKAVAFFAIAVAVGMKLFPWLAGRLGGMKRLGRTGGFTLVLLLALLYAEGAELAGMHGILGAFVAGLFLRESMMGHTRAREMMHLVRDVSLGFLAPIFFVTAGFEVSLNVFSENLGLLVGVIGLATVGKVVGTALFYLPTGHGWREGLTLGAVMNGRGAVEIIVAQIGLSLGLISQEIFSIRGFMAIATTATVPLFLKWGVDWLRNRGELVRASAERTGIVVVGGGPTARALGKVLSHSQTVTIIDRNADHLRLASEDGLQVVQGNALTEEVLAEAEAGRARHLIAMTGNAEVDALAAQLGRTVFLIPEVHVLHSGGSAAGHRMVLEHLGGSTLFARAVDLASWDYRVEQRRVDRGERPVQTSVSTVDLAEQLGRQRECLPLAISRDADVLPFHSLEEARSGDQVLVLQAPEAPVQVLDRFDRLVMEAPVLDLEDKVSAEDFFRRVAEQLAPRVSMEPGQLARALHSRETASSTVLLPGLAIPHVVVEGGGRFEMLIARSRKGIAFPGREERVRAVFVLAGSPDQRTQHLQSLSAIAQIVQWPDFEQRWNGAIDAGALRRFVLNSARRRLPEP